MKFSRITYEISEEGKMQNLTLKNNSNFHWGKLRELFLLLLLTIFIFA